MAQRCTLALMPRAPVEGRIDHDSQQPTLETLRFTQRWQLLPRLEEHFLREVGTIGSVHHQAARDLKNHRMMPLVDLGECGLVPARRTLNELDSIPLVVCRCGRSG